MHMHVNQYVRKNMRYLSDADVDKCTLLFQSVVKENTHANGNIQCE